MDLLRWFVAYQYLKIDCHVICRTKYVEHKVHVRLTLLAGSDVSTLNLGSIESARIWVRVPLNFFVRTVRVQTG